MFMDLKSYFFLSSSSMSNGQKTLVDSRYIEYIPNINLLIKIQMYDDSINSNNLLSPPITHVHCMRFSQRNIFMKPFSIWNHVMITSWIEQPLFKSWTTNKHAKNNSKFLFFTTTFVWVHDWIVLAWFKVLFFFSRSFFNTYNHWCNVLPSHNKNNYPFSYLQCHPFDYCWFIFVFFL